MSVEKSSSAALLRTWQFAVWGNFAVGLLVASVPFLVRALATLEPFMGDPLSLIEPAWVSLLSFWPGVLVANVYWFGWKAVARRLRFTGPMVAAGLLAFMAGFLVVCVPWFIATYVL